jgi:predicted dehydrogenase
MVYKAAVIGCGKIGSLFADDPRVHDIYSHAGAYSACPDTELVAVCDTDEERLKKCGERWDVPGQYTDIRDLLSSEQPDIISICTPDETHFDLIKTAISGSEVKAVFSEKPLALYIDQARELVRLAADHNILLGINYSRRYARNHQHIRDHIISGTLGVIRTVHGYYTKGILHNGTHWLDLARFFLGDIHAVRGFSFQKRGYDDPTLDAIIEFRSGASGYLHGCDQQEFDLFEMDIIGTNGRVRIVDFGHLVEYYTIRDNPYYSGYRTLVLEKTERGGMNNMLLYAVEDLILCLKGEKEEPLCSGRDGVEAIRIADSVRHSALNHKKITL